MQKNRQTRGYVWPCGEPEKRIAVLEIPPVDSAQKAVQVQIVKDVRGKMGKKWGEMTRQEKVIACVILVIIIGIWIYVVLIPRLIHKNPN